MWSFWGWQNHRAQAPKRIEPHDRLQGATNLQVERRNNPTKS